MATLLIVQQPRGERFSLLLHPTQPPMLRAQPPLSQLHFFAPETEEEKRLRQEMGFNTALEAQIVSASAETVAGDNGMVIDTNETSTSRKVVPSSLRPLVPVAQYDSTTSTETIGPAPRASDLQLSSDPTTVHRATLTSPTMENRPIAIDGSTQTQARTTTTTSRTSVGVASTKPVPQSDEDVDMDATKTADELLDANFMSAKPAVAAVTVASTQSRVTTTHTAGMGGDGEDSDGPLPELDSGDSDMEFGEDDEDAEEDADEA
jgi:hypothetical protein